MHKTQSIAIEKLNSTLKNNIISSIFTEIRRFGVLINFGNNQNLCNKLTLDQYFKVWLVFSQEDKRIVKLMAKAAKYYKRVVKVNVWKGLKSSAKDNSVGALTHGLKLKRLAFASIKKY